MPSKLYFEIGSHHVAPGGLGLAAAPSASACTGVPPFPLPESSNEL